MHLSNQNRQELTPICDKQLKVYTFSITLYKCTRCTKIYTPNILSLYDSNNNKYII